MKARAKMPRGSGLSPELWVRPRGSGLSLELWGKRPVAPDFAGTLGKAPGLPGNPENPTHEIRDHPECKRAVLHKISLARGRSSTMSTDRNSTLL